MRMFWQKGHKQKRRIAQKKKKDQNPKLVLIRQIVGGLLAFLFLGLLLTGAWYGSRIEALTLKSVEVIGGETIKHNTIKKIAEEELQGTYYRLIPRAFAWTYPKKLIESRIREVDRLKNVHLERTSGTELTVVFEEYKPFALWCKDAESTECLFMDREGFAFSVAPTLKGGAFLRFSEVGREPERFTTGFDGAYIREITEFSEKVYDELGMNIIQVERTGKDELVYFIAGGGKLKVSRRQSIDETFENLVTLLTSDAFSHIEPGNFQYIDLRYGNKLFVNEEPPQAPGATSTATTTVSTEE